MGLASIKSANISLNNGANIDPRYFADNGNGTYTPTATFIYNVIRDATKFYQEKIYQLDADCTYHTEKIGTFDDTWAEKKKKDALEAKYGDKLKTLEAKKREWREANPDKCTTRAGGPDIGDIDELRYFAGYNPDFVPSLQECVAIYKYLKEYNKEFGDDLKASLPQKPEVLVIKTEFKDEYNAYIEKLLSDLGIDSDEYNQTFEKISRTKYTMARIDGKAMKAVTSDDKGIDDFINGLIEYLTSSTKVEFIKNREECLTLIDKDFVMNFNDTVKDLKAESNKPEANDGIDSIVIYTKVTDDMSPIKFITISRENPTDNYKYLMDITADGEQLRYSKTIATKADLRKALENTIAMIDEVAPFNKYVPDIQATIDTL